MNLIVLFNHTLTATQEGDARVALQVEEIILPPEDIRRLWSEVPPELENLGGWLGPVRLWLSSVAVAGDFVLIQGEFGATCLLVNFCHSQGLTPIYSTTRREAVE